MQEQTQEQEQRPHLEGVIEEPPEHSRLAYPQSPHHDQPQPGLALL